MNPDPRRRRSMTRSLLSGQEGAAVSEFALSTLVLVPIFLYSVYAGEALMVSFKAQEAEISAGWNVTGYLLHDYVGANHDARYAAAVAPTAKRIVKSLTDLDSYAATSRVGMGLLAGKGTLATVTCQKLGGFFSIGAGTGWLHEDGLVGCRASIGYDNKFVPQAFLGSALLPTALDSITVCGLGATFQGCGKGGGFRLLTDDWGLENGAEVRSGGGPNSKYVTIGRAIYGGGSGSAAVGQTLDPIMGGSPDFGATSAFKMFYYSPVSEKRDPGGEGSKRGLLTVYNGKVYAQRRDEHYLGHSNRNFNSP